MKKWYFYTILVVSCFLLLSGCGNSMDSSQTNNKENEKGEETSLSPQETTKAEEAEQPEELGRSNKEEEVEEEIEETEEIDKETAREIVYGIWDTFKDLGTEHRWHNERNPADFEILGPELLNYATEEFTYSDLKELSEEFYCDCGDTSLPYPRLDVRFDIVEKTPTQNVVTTAELYSYADGGPGHVRYTFEKVEGDWKLNGFETKGVDEEPLHLTREEAQNYADSMGEGWELYDEITHEGRDIYVMKNSSTGMVDGLYADTSAFLSPLPEEWGYGKDQDTDSPYVGKWISDDTEDAILTVYEMTDEGWSYQFVVTDFEGPKVMEGEAKFDGLSYVEQPYDNDCLFYFTPREDDKFIELGVNSYCGGFRVENENDLIFKLFFEKK